MVPAKIPKAALMHPPSAACSHACKPSLQHGRLSALISPGSPLGGCSFSPDWSQRCDVGRGSGRPHIRASSCSSATSSEHIIVEPVAQFVGAYVSFFALIYLPFLHQSCLFLLPCEEVFDEFLLDWYRLELVAVCLGVGEHHEPSIRSTSLHLSLQLSLRLRPAHNASITAAWHGLSGCRTLQSSFADPRSTVVFPGCRPLAALLPQTGCVWPSVAVWRTWCTWCWPTAGSCLHRCLTAAGTCAITLHHRLHGILNHICFKLVYRTLAYVAGQGIKMSLYLICRAFVYLFKIKTVLNVLFCKLFEG